MQEQTELVGSRLGAERAIGGEVRLPGFDVIFGSAAPTMDFLIKRLGSAAFEIGGDEAGVGSLITDFDPSDDP